MSAEAPEHVDDRTLEGWIARQRWYAAKGGTPALRTITETGARRVIATHGNTDALIRFLRERGVAAEAFATGYGDEE